MVQVKRGHTLSQLQTVSFQMEAWTRMEFDLQEITVGIRLPALWLPETSSYRTFTSLSTG